jgi:hypothetical protein
MDTTINTFKIVCKLQFVHSWKRFTMIMVSRLEDCIIVDGTQNKITTILKFEINALFHKF